MKRFLLAGALALLVPAVSMAGELHDGVVIDAASRAAYVMSPKGGIDAVDLATGKVIWKSADAAKPLLVKNGTLVAQARPGKAGELVVMTLDARSGATRGRVDVEIPETVRANVFDGPSRSFRVQAVEADGGVVVTWSASEGKAQGAVLPPAMPAENELPEQVEVVTAGAAALSGAVRIDLATGRAVSVNENAISVRTAATPAGPTGRQLASVDGLHILRSERLPEGNLSSRYRWTITDASGAKVGQIDAPIAMAQFVVSGGQVVYVAQPSARKDGSKVVQEPLRLRALDMKTGTELWSAAITDSEYRGPFPP